MSVVAARLSVIVDAITGAAEAKLAALSAQTKAFTASAAAVSGGAIIAVGAIAAIGAAAALSVHAAADFQTQLTQLVTGAGESKDRLGLVSKGILQLALDTGTSTDQLTAGMYMIESAGYHGADGLAVLKAAAEGAKVGAADLGTVADGVTTLMVDFKNQNISAAQAVNLVVATVANGKTHMQDLSSSLSAVAPTAAAAHVRFLDLAASMATMTGEGVPAAEAATYLRQMMIELNAPSKMSKDALEAIGLTTDEVAAKMRQSLPGALKMITDHLKAAYGEDTPKYIQGIKEISGGLRQMQAMLDTTGVHMDTFIDNVSKITTQVTAGGNSIVGWTDVQGTFNQQIAKAGAGVQVLAITLGTYLLPPLTKVAAAVAGAIARFTPFLVSIISNQDAMKKLAPVMGILAGVIGGVFVAALVSLAAVAWAALAPFLVFAAPFILVGVAIAALVIGIKVLVEHFTQIKTWLLNLWNSFNDLAGPIRIMIALLFLPIIPIIALIAGIVLLIKHWKQVTDFLGAVFGPGLVQTKQRFDLITGAVGFLIGKLGDLLGVLGHVKDAIGSGLGNLNTLLKGVHIPGFALGGTTPGGPIVVGEGGPELLIPPAGSRVLPLPGGASGGGGRSAGGAAGAQQTIIIQLDGRVIAQQTVKNMPSAIRLATGVRSF